MYDTFRCLYTTFKNIKHSTNTIANAISSKITPVHSIISMQISSIKNLSAIASLNRRFRPQPHSPSATRATVLCSSPLTLSLCMSKRPAYCHAKHDHMTMIMILSSSIIVNRYYRRYNYCIIIVGHDEVIILLARQLAC